jgi:prephenate dehydrogenase
VVGIAGGLGQMGRWFGRLFAGLGCHVLVSDQGTELDNATLAARSAVVLVCVPIRAMPAVLDEIVAAAGAETLVVSTASLMMPSVPSLRRTRGEALCLHPLFGPATPPASGLLVSATLRPGALTSWLGAALAGVGARVVEMAPEAHDQAMAAVQAMQHACFLAFARALEAAGQDPAAALGVATPTFRLFLALAARILYQDPRLYADIVTLNPHAPAVLEALEAGLREVRMAAAQGDAAAFERLFVQARAYFEADPEVAAGLVADAARGLEGLP